MNPIQAHVRILENTPRERIRTHYRVEKPDPKTAALKRKLAGVHMPMSQEMLERYVELKRAGMRFMDIKKALCVSGRTMGRMRNKAMLAGLLDG